MKFSRVFIAVILIAIAGIGFYSLSLESNDEDYRSAVLEERKQKDDFMKTSEESPFGGNRNSFTGLKYFDPDIKYRVRAKLQSIESKKVVLLPTSTGNENQYLEYAWAEFELDGTKNKLLILEVMAMGPTRGMLFLAFADETSTKETYGSGRYLEVKKVPGATTLELDFNKAYNPYCAYAEKYECPFPPRENILKVAIRAGEKSYH